MAWAKFRVSLVVALGLMAGAAGVRAQGMGHWLKGQKFAPLSEPAEEYWSATANGKFYLFGGTALRTGDKAVLPGRVIEYDPATDKFTTKKPMPKPEEHMTMAEAGGKIYVFGGLGLEHPGDQTAGVLYLKDSWQYDPANDSWKSIAAMPEVRQAGAAVAVGGKIYVMGGDSIAPGGANPPKPDDIIVVGWNEVYDPATNEWVKKSPMPTARNHEAIGTVNGKIYTIGGRIGNANVANMLSSGTDIVEEYDPGTDRWRAMSKMPTPRSGLGWGTYKGMIYVLGGELRDYHADAIFRDVEAFDPAANEWYRLQPMVTARHGVNAAVLGNRLHAIGGHIAFDGTAEHDGDTGVHEVYEFSN